MIKQQSNEVGHTREIPVRAVDLERLGISLTFINTDSAARKDAALKNARLIDCMQDMLECLERYTHMDEMADDTDNNLYRTAKALVSKALGQSGGTP